jgi:hypothetical protein
MDTQALYQERLNRIMGQVALQKTDRTPVMINNDMFAPGHMGIKMSTFVSDVRAGSKAILDSAIDLGADAVQAAFFHPLTLSMGWLSKVDLPGVELPEDSLWQVHERELMTVEDYDVILDKGWNDFYFEFMETRLGDPLATLLPLFPLFAEVTQDFVKAGVVPFNGGVLAPPFEAICGGRSMARFYRDLMKMPDKVQAVLDAVMDDMVEDARQVLGMKPLGVWIGGWRAAPEFINPKLWERFAWPYMKKMADMTIEAGVVPIFHLDSNWERVLPYFKEFPAGKGIIFPDGSTNIYKIKEVLGDHMCINGDVPPSMLTLSTPDEVFNYSTKLIKDMGNGFILGQGCDIPFNAKLENVRAMVSAATGK